MRKWSKEFTCQRCGKRFKATFSDAILPKDQQQMAFPLCQQCRVLMRIQGASIKIQLALEGRKTHGRKPH